MKDILLGHDTSGKELWLRAKLREQTHMHVIGSSGRGKSKFLEWLIRQDLEAGHGLCLIDWHGTLYKDVLRYCAHFRIGLPRWGVPDFRSVILLDPSQPDFITGFNPFMNPGQDVSTQVTRRIKATIRPWGVTNTNDMPTFEFVARLLYTFMAEAQQTLPNAANLLDPEQKNLRSYAMQTASEDYIKQHWRRLQNIKTIKDWEDKVLSTENRLARFIGSRGVKRFMGLTYNNIDLMDIMDTGKILLVNLGPSDFLDEEAARVFASLFLYEFMHTALRRANRSVLGEKPKHFILYLDEFQEYITDDIAAMLEQVRKGGLHMVLAHQHLAQLVNDGNERLKDSIYTNCRVKAVFGGLPDRSAEELANELFLPHLNSRQIKATYTHTIHLYNEEMRVQESRASGHGDTQSTNWAHGTSTGSGSSTTHGSSSGSGSSYGSGSSWGNTTSTGITVPVNATDGAVNATDGVHTTTESTSSLDLDSSSDSSFASDSESESQSEFSSASHSRGGSKTRSSFQTSGETVVPFLKPRPVQEQLPDIEWTLEEKRSRAAEMIINQPQRHCFVKLDTENTEPMTVDEVKDYGLPENTLLEYKHEVYAAQGALPAVEVDRLIRAHHQKFLADAATVIDLVSGDRPDQLPLQAEPSIAGPQDSIWSRQATAPPASPRRVPRKAGSRKPGRKPDLSNHAKVAAIVAPYGTTWDSDQDLPDVCEALDNADIPSPEEWLLLKPPARSWLRGCQLHRRRTVQAIEYRIEHAPRDLD